MMKVRFDEKSFAEKMHNEQRFIKSYSIQELTIYAKWLKYKQLQKMGKDYDEITDEEQIEIEKNIKAALIDFSEKHYGGFNYVLYYKDIKCAVESTRRFKLKIPYPLSITQKEWNVIQNVENENYRKVLFVMLVDAKFYRYFNTSLTKKYEINEDTVFYCQMEDAEIFRVSKVKFTDEQEKISCFYTLHNLGLIDFKFGKYDTMFVTFVDISDDDIIDYITDYDNLDLHYRKLCGENITKCKVCGSLITQNIRGTRLYCNEHKGYNKQNFHKEICIDCGKEFLVSPNVTMKKRCNECQCNYRKMKDRERKNKNSTSALKD